MVDNLKDISCDLSAKKCDFKGEFTTATIDNLEVKSRPLQISTKKYDNVVELEVTGNLSSSLKLTSKGVRFYWISIIY
jgi:hypothetical protein